MTPQQKNPIGYLVGEPFKLSDWDLTDSDPEVARLATLQGCGLYEVWQLYKGQVVVSVVPDGPVARRMFVFGPMSYGEALVRIAYAAESDAAGPEITEDFVRMLIRVAATVTVGA